MIGKSDCNYARRGTLNKKYLLPISYKTDGLRKYRELLCLNVYQDHTESCKNGAFHNQTVYLIAIHFKQKKIQKSRSLIEKDLDFGEGFGRVNFALCVTLHAFFQNQL